MTILAIETSTKVCSAALIKDGGAIVSRIDQEGGNHAKQLPLFIEELLQYARQAGLKTDAVALSEGPGSYTGLRIGTSTAKGLCYGLDIPLIGIPTPEVLCASFAAEKQLSEECYLLPMIDARRMEVYTGLYTFANGYAEKASNITACVVESAKSVDFGQSPSESKPLYFFGDGAGKCVEQISSEHAHYIAGIVPNAAYMGGIAERMFQEGKACMKVTELAYYEPFYLKEFVAAKSHVKGLIDHSN